MDSRLDNIDLLFGASRRPCAIAEKLVLGFGAQVVLPKPLPTPSELHANSQLLEQRWDGLTVLRRIPLFTQSDSPTASLYRMSEFLSADDSNALMLEMQYFWDGPHALWTLEDIPDPQDSNKERYAIIASLIESLAVAFAFRRSMGLRRERDSAVDNRADQLEVVPSWVANVPALDYLLVLRREDEFFHSNNDPFSRRNIKANSGNLFSI